MNEDYLDYGKWKCVNKDSILDTFKVGKLYSSYEIVDTIIV